ncbi:MAG TPA: saccharopine dehydrogenase NADP-binding domain-containing protein [Candidatus Xenobia bacterium]|nr:saccharopine dehydrogenase NADP-binding domain-containing protein [Candidatus Xenobia bacterium]
MRIFVLGVGATGGLLAQLLERQGHEIRCGDRDPERARRFLGREVPCEEVNARNLWALVRAARGSHLIVNAVPAMFNQIVLRAALRLRAHYFDMASNLRRHPFKPEQFRYQRAFLAKRRVALINAGVAPGLTNLLVAASVERLDKVESVHIRLYESTESRDPISQWSPESAFDEAVSRPRVYRNGRFAFAPRFSEPEWFTFPEPIGRARVVLAAQDEVSTLPRLAPMRELDVKIGGNEIARLRRLYRRGRLRPARRPPTDHFPRTPTPRQVARLIRRGILSNARFAAAVVIRGERKGQRVEHRWTCMVPSLYQLRQRGLLATPIAYATAQVAAAILKRFPRDLWGVHPPEALPPDLRRAVLADLKARDFELSLKVRELKTPEEPFEEL